MVGLVDGNIARLAPAGDDAIGGDATDQNEGHVHAVQEGSRERKVLDPAKIS